MKFITPRGYFVVQLTILEMSLHIPLLVCPLPIELLPHNKIKTTLLRHPNFSHTRDFRLKKVPATDKKHFICCCELP